MKLSVGQMISGFRVQRAGECRETGGNTFYLEHELTGAKVFWLDNGSENMVFSITFRTLPEDSTGVFHILEHSVLCGSNKYPMKEPFVELLKSSMNTFLNAMTYPERTVYPAASCNRHDFFNLLEVYWDAVFHPNITRQGFAQEGWHYELNGGKGVEKLIRNGIVLNEMTGYYSSF